MDLKSLSNGQKIALGSALALLVASFLPWYGAFGFSINAWDSEFWAWGGVLLGVAAGVIIALKVFAQQKIKAGNLAAEQIALLLAAASAVFIILRLITESSATKFGLYLGLAAAAGTAFGAFQSMREAGLAMPTMDDFRAPGQTGAPPVQPAQPTGAPSPFAAPPAAAPPPVAAPPSSPPPTAPPVAPPAPPPVPTVRRARVPAEGLPVWNQPNPSDQPAGQAGGGLEVEILEDVSSGWARVRFSNGWEGWLDGRRLNRL